MIWMEGSVTPKALTRVSMMRRTPSMSSAEGSGLSGVPTAW